MDQLLIQRTRYLLRARFRRAQTCPESMLVNTCVQLIEWIGNHPLLCSVANELAECADENIGRIRKTLVEAPNARGGYEPGRYQADKNFVHSAVCYQLVLSISHLVGLDERKRQFTISNFGEFLNGDSHIKYEDAVSVLRDVALDGLYEYLDEHLDQRNAIYSILIKYKQRSEWFRKSRLREYAENGLEGKLGERALAIDVQEYILDQGVEFFVEPTSASGEVDLILKSSEGRYIVVDAKYIKAGSNRSTIATKLSSGFHQVSKYCNDFNVTEGFLVNFVADSTRIRLELDEADGFPYLLIGNKRVYYIEVNIADELSASKLGKAVEIEISAHELVSSEKA